MVSKMQCHRIVLVTLGFICFVTSQADSNSLQKRAGKRYCGETLNNMLMLLCEGFYNKRSGSTETDMMNWLPNEPDASPFVYEEQSDFPFKSRDNAVSLIPRQYKRRGGVADECCSKPCTLAELSSYCGARPR